MRGAGGLKNKRSALSRWSSGRNAKRRMSVRPEIRGCVEMPVDYQRRTGNSLRRLHDKMILKNSRVADLGNKVFGFVDGSGWT